MQLTDCDLLYLNKYGLLLLLSISSPDCTATPPRILLSSTSNLRFMDSIIIYRIKFSDHLRAAVGNQVLLLVSECFVTSKPEAFTMLWLASLGDWQSMIDTNSHGKFRIQVFKVVHPSCLPTRPFSCQSCVQWRACESRKPAGKILKQPLHSDVTW